LKAINSNNPPCLVIVYGKEILINTNDGSGFCKVFERMKPSIIKLSKFYCSISEIEYIDAYQDICTFMLEGILKYQIGKSSLSSFLHLYAHNKIIDSSRKKKDPIKYSCFYNCEKIANEQQCVIMKIDILKCIEKWDYRWRSIIFRVFIKEDPIGIVAKDENITGWGLTRAIRKKLKEARNI